MGLDLYDSGVQPVRAVWDEAEAHFLKKYGISLIDIVRHNPKELFVSFAGPRGQSIRFVC
jgi:hypothetical protein